ncbi:MAG: phage integrase N-terminal SAM-like domain-containing protein [archaeon]
MEEINNIYKYNKDCLKFRIKGKTIDEYESCKDWIDSKRTNNTKKNYKSALQQYVKFTNKTPDELKDEVIDDLKNGVIQPELSNIKNIKKFKNYLNNEIQSSQRTINQRLRCIINFYKYHDLPISTNTIIHNPSAKEGNNERLTYDEIKKVLNFYTGDNPLMRTYIMVALSSGLASDDIISLTVGDV